MVPKERKIKAKDVLFSFVLAIILMIFPVVSGIIVTVNNIDGPQMYWLQGAFMLLATFIPIVFLLITKVRPSQIGFVKVTKGSWKTVLYFIPLIIAKIGYLFYERKHGVALLCALVFFTLAVGVAEELYFRGIILRRLLHHFSIKQAVLLSAVAFAIVHAAEAFSGAGFVDVFLTIINAFIFGVVAAELVVLTNSILPTFIWHTGYNFINWTSLVSGTNEVILIIIELLIMLMYGLYLWPRLAKKADEPLVIN